MEIILPAILIIIGFVLLIKGADFLVEGSSDIAKRFHIPEIVIGLTIVSIGTSLPELLVSLNSATKGYSDMSLGNAIGSNICNLLLILGTSASIRRLKLKKETRYIEVPLCILYTIIFTLLCNTSNMITRVEAVVLILFFSAFIGYTVAMGIKGEKYDEEAPIDEDDDVEKAAKEKDPGSLWRNIIQILIGIVALKFGGDFIVDNSVIIAEFFNISEKIISLTIIAIGTSLPELVTSVTAAIKGENDIAIGNIIGSNIFNMLFIIGTTAILKPIAYNISYNLQMIILFIGMFLMLIFPFIKPKDELSRKNGIIIFILYIIYMTILFLEK